MSEVKTPQQEKVEMITDELKKVSAIEAVYLSEGGQMIFKSLMADVVSAVDTLSVKYSSFTREDFISLCADMKSKLDLARVLKKSTKNKDQAKADLEEALLEN